MSILLLIYFINEGDIRKLTMVKYLKVQLPESLPWDLYIKYLKLEISPALCFLHKFKNKLN